MLNMIAQKHTQSQQKTKKPPFGDYFLRDFFILSKQKEKATPLTGIAFSGEEEKCL